MQSSKEYWEKAVPMTFSDKPEMTYEQKRKFRYDLQDYMRDVIPFKNYRGKRVIELGFGSGIDSIEFARNGAHVTAYDFTAKAFLQASKNLKQSRVWGVTFVQYDLNHFSEINMKEKSVDLIYSFGVLHHIENPEPIIQKCSKLLTDSGRMIVMLYNRDSLLYSYSIEHLKQSTERIDGCPYTKAYTGTEALELFAKYFRKVSCNTFYNVIDMSAQRKVKLNIPNQLGLGWHHIIKCSDPLP